MLLGLGVTFVNYSLFQCYVSENEPKAKGESVYSGGALNFSDERKV